MWNIIIILNKMRRTENAENEENTEESSDNQLVLLSKLNRKYGWMTLMGGFFLHMMLGWLYSYGNMCLYVASIYYKYDNFSEWGKSISSLDHLDAKEDYIGDYNSDAYILALVVFPLQLFFISISMPIGVKILQGSSAKNNEKSTAVNNTLPDSINSAAVFQNAESLMPIWAPMTIGSVFMIGGVFLSSFVMSNKVLFTILHGVFFGFGYGLWYMAPIIAAYKFFPQKQGFVNGIIMTGFSLGSLTYCIIVFFFVVKWIDPIMHITGGNIFNMCQTSIEGGFDVFISRIHWIMWTLCIIWALLSVVSLVLMYDREDILEIKRIEILNDKLYLHSRSANTYEIMDDEGLRERGVDIKIKRDSISETNYYRSYFFSEGIWDISFRELILMMTFSSVYLISIIFLFKPMIETGDEKKNMRDAYRNIFSYDELTGDNLLILIDAFANFLWGIFRIIWGYFVDYFGFKTWYTIIVSIEIILIILSLMIGNDAIQYWNLINILASYILIGGHFAIFPAVFSKIFGNKLGSLLYSLSFISYALSAIISLIIYIIWNKVHE